MFNFNFFDMKKIFCWIVVAALAFSACGKDGMDGKDGLDGLLTYWKVIDFTVSRPDWVRKGEGDQIGSYFYYVFDVPEISQKIYDNGLIVCYYRFEDDFGDDVQTVLPYTYYDIIVDDYGNELPYSVQYSFDVTPGSIAFKVVFSDFYTAEYDPPTCFFKLQILY